MKHEAWKSKGNCVYETWYHVVWSTKYRCKVLTPPIDEAAKELLQEICTKHGCEMKGLEVTQTIERYIERQKEASEER